jgi:hypothetical protein
MTTGWIWSGCRLLNFRKKTNRLRFRLCPNGVKNRTQPDLKPLIVFSIAENWFFQDFLYDICPWYMAPSHYVLSHSILGSEAARVQIEEMAYMKDWKRLTLLIDGWEDILKRSLYRSVAVQIGQYPSILSLTDMTGERASVEGIFGAVKDALATMGSGDGRNFIAATTDNPTVMQSFQRKFKAEYFWLLVTL